MKKNKQIISFRNEDTKKDISLKLDKKMIFIYGKNGSGKTSFSRSKDLDNKYVFNEDFVYKNVYIIDEEGAKVDSNVKNNFSELLIGEDVVSLKKKQNELETLLKDLNGKSNDNQTSINSRLTECSIPLSYNSIKSIVDRDYEFDPSKSTDEQLKLYKSSYELDQLILNDEELKTNVNQIRKNENIKVLIDKIKSIPILNEFLFNEKKIILEDLNKKIEYLNLNVDEIKKLEELGKKKNIDKKDFPIIKECIGLQEKIGMDNCVLCGNENIKDGIIQWKKIFEDKTIKLKEDIIKELNIAVNSSERIMDDKEIYEPVAPKTIVNINIFIEIIKKSLEKIKNDEITYIKYPYIGKESYTDDIQKKYIAIANYILKKYKDTTIFLNTAINTLNGNIKNIKQEIEKKLQHNAENHNSSINTILKELGLEKEISVNIDRFGGKIKYSLSVVGNDLSKLSDGQKHKLALAVFLNSIYQENLKDKIVVFDDPVVSLDELGYHFFKQYVRKNIMKEPNIEDCPTLIILTHNFNYLYIQTSNIIIDKDLQENTKILKLNSSGFKELNFELFKLDDIALFKKCVDKIKYEDELLDLSSLYNKIFREFLDLKMRILGNPLNGNPKEEIQQVISNCEKCVELQKKCNKLSNYSKKKNITLEESKEGFNLLVDMLKSIGFEQYILDEHIQNINNVKKREEMDKSDLFYIIHEISEILRTEDDKYKNYINYLNHPRISFTKNMMSTSMDT